MCHFIKQVPVLNITTTVDVLLTCELCRDKPLLCASTRALPVGKNDSNKLNKESKPNYLKQTGRSVHPNSFLWYEINSLWGTYLIPQTINFTKVNKDEGKDEHL